MQEFDKTIEDMRNLQEYVSGKLVDKRSFVQFVTAFTTQWKQLQATVIKHIDAVYKQLTGKMAELSQQVKTTETTLLSDIKQTKQALAEDIMNTRSVLEEQIDATSKLLRDKIEEPIDFSEIEQNIENIREQIPKEFDATEIEERISALEDKLEELASRKPTTIIQGGGGGVMGRDLVKDIDLTAQLDGTTKTFNLQAIHTIVSVSLSSYPYGTLRKGIDFTWTPTSITFTDTIDASTQLAEGQKCILTIVQA